LSKAQDEILDKFLAWNSRKALKKAKSSNRIRDAAATGAAPSWSYHGFGRDLEWLT
jgi:hypothetical protein